MQFHKTIYKVDTKGKIRVWYVESDHEKYRVYSGLQDGKLVISGWKFPTKKNVGRSNETSVEQQVLQEVNSMYDKQLYQGGYSYEITTEKKFFEPMLAEKYDNKKLVLPIYSQPKLDGCLSGNTYVDTELGKMTLRQLLETDAKFISSYNNFTQKIEYKKILGKYRNAYDINPNKNKKWLRITLESGNTITLTFDHRVFLPELDAWREAKDLEVGNNLLKF